VRTAAELKEYQLQAIDRMVREGQLALFLPMGLGKTVITETALVELKRQVQKFHVLVVAPAMVVKMDVWGHEVEKWEHLQGLRVQSIAGTPEQRLIRLFHPADVDVISYELLPWLLDQDIVLGERYQAIVFDELSRMKHPGTTRFKRLRRAVQGVPYRFGLTGTPVGNHLLDLWGEMFMVTGENALGPRFVDFRNQYFMATDYEQRVWVPKHGTEEALHERIRPYAISLSREFAAQRIPPVHVNELDVPLPAAALQLEHDLATKAKAVLNTLELQACSASALAMKVRQLASGAVYCGIDGEWEEVHDAKLEAMETVVAEQQGRPLLGFYWFRHELDRMQKRFPFARVGDDSTALQDWCKGKVELLLAHPASVGHGLNLQSGGNEILWYTLPWSLELWNQSNGRLARLGQKAPYVMASVLLAGEMDRAVLEVLRQKERVESRLMVELELERGRTC
jgi:SNF2 family DNA or RNA helicase